MSSNSIHLYEHHSGMFSGWRISGSACLVLTLCVGRVAGAQSAALYADLPDAPSAVVWQAAAAASSAQSFPQGETEEERKARLRAQAEREVKGEEHQRIAAVVPNFNTVLTGKAVPLDKRQKTDLALHATFDPFNAFGALFLAGLSEVSDSNRGYGWGPSGYFKRVGANVADVVDGTMLAGAVYPILLHQDPRFFRQATGPIKSRLRHALIAPFVCRGDNQRPQFNFSNILGNFTAGAISNAYYPSDERGISLTLENSSIVTIEGSLGNIGLEFAPDVEAYLRRRVKRKKADPTAGTLDQPASVESATRK